jgi:DeoR family L-fucose operon activator
MCSKANFTLLLKLALGSGFMRKLEPSKRLEKIMEILNSRDSIPTEELSKVLCVSLVTLRRDLKQLQDSGMIVNGYGFIKKIENEESQDARFTKRLANNRAEKEKMARSALTFINEGDVIFLDESTTSYVLALSLVRSFSNLHIITNGVHTLLALSKAHGFTVESSGGSLMFGFNSLIGPRAEMMLKDMFANKFFFSCRAFRKNVGTYELSPFSASIKRIMLNNSEKNFLLVDHTKIGASSPFPFAKINEIQTIITDQKIEGVPFGEIENILIAD